MLFLLDFVPLNTAFPLFVLPVMSLTGGGDVRGNFGDKQIVEDDNDKPVKQSLSEKVVRRLSAADDDSTKDGQMYSMAGVDPALDAKMNIVNDVCSDHTTFSK